MPMKGRFPIRRTLQYLAQGTVVFKDSVKVMTVNYNTHGELGEGARKFVFFNIPQIQYKNPWVQIMMFKNMTPTPFLRFYLDSGEQVLVDVETKSNKEIVEHVRKILGKSEVTPRTRGSTFQWADRAWPHQPQERPPPVRRGRSTLRPPTLMQPPLDRTGGQSSPVNKDSLKMYIINSGYQPKSRQLKKDLRGIMRIAHSKPEKAE
ncbi:small ribosomal subunit protein mS25 isoform X2 [Marmota monax]|uniref:small ribosomal subunit protein mS25 isoform X2 n=1 Tax=Marmota monax TaxID=9995 RepID=UPI001EB04970|nr:small ribosomal subunit protein mS25 isoform X2 [Marmota monax]